MRKLTLIAVLCGFAAMPGWGQDRATPKTVEVPFTFIETGHFLVKVKVNDKGPFNLIFDTGAPTSIVDNALAGKVGLSDGKRGFLFGATGTPKTIDRLELGSLQAKKVMTMVIDHPTVSAFSNYYQSKHGEPIHGILGFPFFAKYATTVNYQTRMLKFVPVNYEPEDIMQVMMRTMMNRQNKPKPKVLSPGAFVGVTFDESASGPGVLLKEVSAGSPAALAGLRAGDRLLTLDGRWTDTVKDAFAAGTHLKPGQAVPLTYQRGDQETSATLTPRAGF
jgi:membrane-associated protease RseP (regulator of RpoE activity)